METPLCNSCGSKMASSQIVISRGNPLANLMIIGEAPGAKEDELGKPFVGRSGKVLDDLLISVEIDINKDVYICNVVKTRPPKNRRPSKTEIELSFPWLSQQIKLVDPIVIVLLGATAVEAILGIRGGISTIRGTWQNWEGKLVMPLFHPSYLLRKPSKEKGSPFSLTRSDLMQVKKKLSQSDLVFDFSSSVESRSN